MKNLILFICIVFTSIGVKSQEKVVENPSFSVASHNNVIIEKVEITPQSTKLHMMMMHSPRHWMRISSETYIRVGDSKFIVLSSEGIELDKEVFSDQTNKTYFVLTFPSIDPKTERIDFIESDCEDCFKIWGVELQSKNLTDRRDVPAHIRKQAKVKDDGKPLEVPAFKSGKALLKGKFLAFRTDMNRGIDVYVNNPVVGTQEEYNTKIKDDGTFELEIPLVTTFQSVLFRNQFVSDNILLSPGKETSIYVDMQQMSSQKTVNGAIKRPDEQFIFFEGANAEINNQMLLPEVTKCMEGVFTQNKLTNEVAGMTALQYKAYILGELDKGVSSLASLGLSQKVQQFAGIRLRGMACYYLLSADYYLENAYRTANKLNWDAPLTGYKAPIINKEYYSLVKEMGVNNALSLYDNMYYNNINSCKYAVHHSKPVTLSDPPAEAYQKLIDSGQLTAEELVIAQFLKKNCMENWSKELVASRKLYEANVVQLLIDSLSLTKEDSVAAQKAMGLCLSPESKIKDVIEERVNFQAAFAISKRYTNDYLDKLVSQVVFNQGLAQNDTLPQSAVANVQPFYNKYKDQLELFKMMQALNERIKPFVADLVGSSEGILFDLMTAQSFAGKFQEFTPLTEEELNFVSELKDPFFYTYLSDKSKEIVAINEKNKLKGGYTIHEVPQTKGEQLLADIMKPFEGKVVMIDFWATWCSPCRSAIKSFEEAKKGLKEKGVVFVYLTDESSPINAWQNMISNIPGEHYRLTPSQFDELKKKFNYRGVPSYLIINKKGEQVYSKTGFEGSSVITNILKNELNK